MSGTSGGAGNSGGASSGDGDMSGGAFSGGNDNATSSGGANTNACEAAAPLTLGEGFNCGDLGHIFFDRGPHTNRVNYVLLGDGYLAADLETVYINHLTNMLEHEQGMFGDLSEPYRTYRNFINICALKIASNDSCVDDLDTGLQCDTAFDGYGDDASRLGIVDDRKVRAAVATHMPNEIDVDWIGVSINAGADNWWNSGGGIMVFNGGFQPSSHAASVALHEGGHTFHALADEYDGTNTNCSSAPEMNVSTDNSGSKWADWLGFDHAPGTGPHGSYEGGRYCKTGIYRPTQNSEMNQLPDYFNMPSIQKMIHDIYDIVDPIDAHTDNNETLINPAVLQVRVIDEAVLKIEWSVDEALSAEQGSCFDTSTLSAGSHVVTARVSDPTPWVRDARDDLEQSVSWTVEVR